jgi:hypothetical protein
LFCYFFQESIIQLASLHETTKGFNLFDNKNQNVDRIQQMRGQHSQMVFIFRRCSPSSNLWNQSSSDDEEADDDDDNDNDELNWQRE